MISTRLFCHDYVCYTDLLLEDYHSFTTLLCSIWRCPFVLGDTRCYTFDLYLPVYRFLHTDFTTPLPVSHVVRWVDSVVVVGCSLVHTFRVYGRSTFTWLRYIPIHRYYPDSCTLLRSRYLTDSDFVDLPFVPTVNVTGIWIHIYRLRFAFPTCDLLFGYPIPSPILLIRYVVIFTYVRTILRTRSVTRFPHVYLLPYVTPIRSRFC